MKAAIAAQSAFQENGNFSKTRIAEYVAALRTALDAVSA